MVDKTYFLFDRSTKIGVVQFALVLLTIFILNTNKFYLEDKYQVLLFGTSLFVSFALISHDQTKIFGFKFRLTGLFSSLFGLLLIYSPIILNFIDIVDINLWLDLIIIGFGILSVSVISDYYLIGVPEIVRAIHYALDFIKKIPLHIFSFSKLFLKYSFLVIPIFIYSSLFKHSVKTDESAFATLLALMIFFIGLIKIFNPNLTAVEQNIRSRAKNIIVTVTTAKWKFDFKISHYKCQNCKQIISVTDSTCQYCQTEINTCLICKLPIKGSQPMAHCQSCEYTFHSNHWNFWITSKGSCPNCKTMY